MLIKRFFFILLLVAYFVNTGLAKNRPSPGKPLALVNAEGRAVSLDEYKGKVVFINFWATWCPPCVKELPSINRLKKEYSNRADVVFLMVDVDGKLKQSTAFMKKNQFDFEVFGLKGSPPPQYLGNAIPTTVILDRNGQMVSRLEGGREYDTPSFKSAFAKLVNGK